MKRVLFAFVAVLFGLAVALGGSVPFSSAGPAVANPESPGSREALVNHQKVREAFAMLRSADLQASGIPLAGWYQDPGTATIHVGLTDMADEYTEPIRAIVGQVDGVEVEFFEARFTAAELYDMQRKLDMSLWPISPEAEHGVPFTFIGARFRTQSLLIGLEEIRPEYIAAIREVVGDEVPIEFAEGGLVERRTGTHRPLLGGIQVTTEGASTLSFQAEADGESGLVMSGHAAGSVGNDVWQPAEASVYWVGEVGANPPGFRFSDAAFVPTDIPINTMVWPERDIIHWEASHETWEGYVVMKEGIATGGTQGVIEVLHVTTQSPTYSRLYNQVLATYEDDDGDSGSPVFWEDPGGYAIILGTHWGWNPYLGLTAYSPVEGIVFDLGLDGFPLQGAVGLVWDAYSGFPLQNAQVEVEGTGYWVYSHSGGSYTILLGPGQHTLTASYPLFYPKTYTVQVSYGAFTTRHFALEPMYPGYPYPMDADDPLEATADAP